MVCIAIILKEIKARFNRRRNRLGRQPTLIDFDPPAPHHELPRSRVPGFERQFQCRSGWTFLAAHAPKFYHGANVLIRTGRDEAWGYREVNKGPIIDENFQCPRTGCLLAMLERFLLLWLILLCLAAFVWPEILAMAGNVRPSLAATGFDPFLASGPGLNALFAVTMLAVGSLLPRNEVTQVFRRGWTVLGGTMVQYTVMPLLAYCLGRVFGLQGPLFVGMVLVGCVPGAMASNVLTLMAKGNTSYSVSLTTSATILSPILVPLTMALALRGTQARFPWEDALLGLSWMVVLPVVAGHLLSRRSTAWARGARRVGSTVANLSILWIIAVVVAKNRDHLTGIEPKLFAALLSLNSLGYTAGFYGGRLLRLPASMRRALTLEVGMQNAGLGTVLAMNLFGDETTTSIPPALYTFGCMFTGTVLARWWSGREPEDYCSIKS